MRPSARRGARRLAGGLLLALIVALAGVPAWSAPASAATPDASPAQITLLSVNPTPIGPRDTLTVTGTIRNTGTVPISYLTARLHLLTTRLGTREDLAEWTTGLSGTGGVVGRTVDLYSADDPTLPTGASMSFTLTLNQAELGLGGSPFGVFGLAVEARGQVEGPRQQVGLTRTTIIWQPTVKEYAAQQLSWLVPFTGLPGTTSAHDLTVQQVAAAVGPGSRLDRVLRAASAPGIDWAVDPALLETLAIASKDTTSPGQTPATTPTDTATTPTDTASTPTDTATSTGTATSGGSASDTPTSGTTSTIPSTGAAGSDDQAREVVRTFLRNLRTAAQGRVVIELPYGDPDVQAISTAGRPGLLGTAMTLTDDMVRTVLGVVPLTGVGWPADGWADEAALATLVAQGADTVVLDARSWAPVSRPDYTLDARATLPEGSTGLLADPVVSALVANRTADPVARLNQVLAQTAAMTSERPGLSRRMLIALPRDFDPDPIAFLALFDAVSAVPWTMPVPISNLTAPLPRGDTSDLARSFVTPPSSVVASRLDHRDVTAAHDLNVQVGALHEVLQAPEQVTTPLFRDVVSLVSSAWRGHAGALRSRRAVVSAEVRRTVGSVHVLPTRANLLANSASLPFTVANDLGEPVDGLRLQVVAPSPRLEVLRPVTDDLRLEPGTKTRVEVPVRAVASGRVVLTAQLLTPSGTALGEPVSVRVRTQPPGTWAFWTAGAIVALILAIGLVRTLRRPRQRVHPPDATPHVIDEAAE